MTAKERDYVKEQRMRIRRGMPWPLPSIMIVLGDGDMAIDDGASILLEEPGNRYPHIVFGIDSARDDRKHEVGKELSGEEKVGVQRILHLVFKNKEAVEAFDLKFAQVKKFFEDDA